MLDKRIRSLGQILEKPCEHYSGHSFDPIFLPIFRSHLRKTFVYTLEGIVLIQSSLHFVVMLIRMKFRSNWKLGHIGLKTRLLGQSLLFREHSFGLKFMKLCQNCNLNNI